MPKKLKNPEPAGSGKKGRPAEDISVDELLKQLDNTEDQKDKRKIRAKLRARGHRGGLGRRGRPPAAGKGAGKKVAGSKKPSRTPAQVAAGEDEGGEESEE